MRLQGLIAVVTGAGIGIGKATALRFAEEGARLILAERDEARLTQVAARVRDLRAQALPIPCDVTDEASVTNLSSRPQALAQSQSSSTTSAVAAVVSRTSP